jgi:hypothetical protein
VIEQEMIMLKTISAALLAVSVLAAPAMAAGVTHARTHATKSVIFTGQHVNHGVFNAQARMKKHHVRHHRHHVVKKMHIRRGHRH